LEQRESDYVIEPSAIGEPVSDQKFNEIIEALKILKADSYEIWLQVGQALHSITERGSDPFIVWDEWSKTADNYDGSTAKKWRSFKSGKGINYEMIFKIAKDEGIDLSALAPIDDDIDNMIRNGLEKYRSPKEHPEVSIKDTLDELPPNYAGEATKIFSDAYHVIPEHIAMALASQFLPSAVF